MIALLRHQSRRPHSGTIRQSGFTIIELLIATTVFTFILLVISQALLHYTNSFYKGVNASTTQNVARNIIEVVSQAIEYGVSNPVYAPNVPTALYPQEGTWCIGTTQFDFMRNQQLDTSASPPIADVLWQSPVVSPAGGCAAARFNAVGHKETLSHELMATHMRLSNFEITQIGTTTPKLWRVDITVAYGDDDLLDLTDPTAPSCKAQAGSQWCSVSSLSVTVQRRLDSNL